jgi:hypothetical protein
MTFLLLPFLQNTLVCTQKIRMSFKIKVAAALLLAGTYSNLSGQVHSRNHQCHAVKGRMAGATTAAKTTVNHPDEDKYDVKYVKLNLEMSNVSTTLSGDVTTQVQVTASSL